MRRTVLSAGVSAGASLRERKSPGDYPNPPFSLPKSGGHTPIPCRLYFSRLIFQQKKRQLNFILKNRETGDNRPIARFLLYYYVDYFTVTILFKTLKLTVFCLNGKTASEFNLMPFFAPPFSGYKTSNPKSA